MMTSMMLDPNLMQFIKPNLDTPFHIDYEWWERQGLDLNMKLVSHLCPEHRDAYVGEPLDDKIDWVDWETGEVRQVDGLQYVISTHCSKQPGYISGAPTIVEAVFRAFLANGNDPLSPQALAALVNQPAERILRVLSGRQVRLGLRPAPRT
jgi:hypothetical protein